MDKILFWEPDPDFRKALAVSLTSLGYKPVALEDYRDIPNAVSLERPQMFLLSAELERGTRLNFNEMAAPSGTDCEMSVILPEFSGPENGGRLDGIVLDNIRKPFGMKELDEGLRWAVGLKGRLEHDPALWEDSLEVRELSDKDEIRQALVLRYDVYREVGFLQSSEQGLDIDPFDVKSVIFGAFVNIDGREELAGAIRIIQHSGYGPHRLQIEEIMRDCGMEPNLLESGITSTLPALETFGLTAADCRRYYPDFGTRKSAGRRMVSSQIYELSRLVIKRDYRLNRAGIERRLYELVVAYCCAKNPPSNWFVIAIHPSKVKKYARFGFLSVASLGIKSYTGIEQPAALMIWDLQRYLQYPNPFTAELAENILHYHCNSALSCAFQGRARVAAEERNGEPEYAEVN